MDFIKWKESISKGIGKYKYVCLILLIGMLLMMVPGKSTKVTVTDQNEIPSDDLNVAEQLEEILCRVKGAGRVKVMITEAQGERTIYQTDSSYSQNSDQTNTQTQTILITDNQRNEKGLIHQKNPPTYQGAIVLAQGADDPNVKYAIVQAVCDVTGLGADRISVMKMQ